jgi:hypothetical protein
VRIAILGCVSHLCDVAEYTHQALGVGAAFGVNQGVNPRSLARVDFARKQMLKYQLGSIGTLACARNLA